MEVSQACAVQHGHLASLGRFSGMGPVWGGGVEIGSGCGEKAGVKELRHRDEERQQVQKDLV